MPEMTAQADQETRRPRDLRRRLSAIGKTFAESRGSRFARRKGLAPQARPLPTLADMINLPEWRLCDENIIGDIAAVTALLHFRHALDHELSGKRLRAICESVGEYNYDLACAAPIPASKLIADVESKLPSPDQLKLIGQAMLDRALPATMRPKVMETCDDVNMRILSNIATALVLGRHNASLGNPA